jgi:hypothetical protein
MDCQFLMALYTWVHYNSFVKFSTISVPKLTYMYSLLSEQQKADFIRIVTTNLTSIDSQVTTTTSSPSSTMTSDMTIEIDGNIH